MCVTCGTQLCLHALFTFLATPLVKQWNAWHPTAAPALHLGRSRLPGQRVALHLKQPAVRATYCLTSPAVTQLGPVDLPELRALDVRGASLARQRPSPVPGFEVTWLPVAAVVAGCPRLRALSWTRQHWDRLQCRALGCALPATLARLTVQVTDTPPALHCCACVKGWGNDGMAKGVTGACWTPMCHLSRQLTFRSA